MGLLGRERKAKPLPNFTTQYYLVHASKTIIMCREKSCIKLNETMQSFQNIFYYKIISKNQFTWMENITIHLKKILRISNEYKPTELYQL